MVEVSKTRRDLKITTVLGVLGLLVVLQLEVDFGYPFFQNFPLLEVLETQPTSISGLGNLTTQESAVFFYSEISGFRVPGPMSYGTIGSVGPCHWKAKEKSWWGDEGEGSEDELHWEAL